MSITVVKNYTFELTQCIYPSNYYLFYSMKRQNEAKLLQLSTTIQNNLQKLMSSTFQRTLQENVIIKSEVSFFILMKVITL